jgi:RecA-family ATPase
MQPSKILLRQAVEPNWIVKDMLPRNTSVLLAGEAGAGKSFLSYTLAYCVAAGLPFLGHQTFPTNVLYFDEENGEPDFLQYNRWVWAGLGCPSVELLDQRLRIEHGSLTAGWKNVMSGAIKDWRAGLVIIDTATPAFGIKDENDNAEANEIMRLLRLYRRAGSDTTFLILKHEKMNDDVSHRRTIRGAKAWLGAADQVLYHVVGRGRRRKDGLRKTRLIPDKMRAFGLRQPLVLDPQWREGEAKGLILNATIGLYHDEHDQEK